MTDEDKLYVHPIHGNVFGKTVLTPPGRLIWPHIAKPSTRYQAKYQATIIWDKDAVKANPKMEKALEEMLDKAEACYAAGKVTPKQREKFLYPPIKDGDDQAAPNKLTENQLFILAKSNEQPELLGPAKQKIGAEMFQPGVIVRAYVQPVLFLNNGGGIAWTLQLLQLIQDDGVRLRGGPNLAVQLPDLEDEDTGMTPEEEPAEEEETEEEEAPPAKPLIKAKPVVKSGKSAAFAKL